MLSLFFNLLLAHLVADFWLQWDGLVRNKNEKHCRGWALWTHAAIVFFCTWAASGEKSFWLFAVSVAVTHFVIDWIKTRYSRHHLIPFLLDQVLHVVILVAISGIYLQQVGAWTQFAVVKDHEQILLPALACAIIAMTRPANILIKEVFAFCGVFEDELRWKAPEKIDIANGEVPEDKVRNAGAIVGTLERLLALAFVVKGDYQALGFLLTAKSILRFKLDDARKAEYVLAGTLLSILIVLIVAKGVVFLRRGFLFE